MKISVKAVTKRFFHHSIFKNVSLEFEAPQSYALLGANGSGKSTLLRIIAGMQSPTKGTVLPSIKGRTVPPEALYQYTSFCAPGMELVEEMTLQELLQFHFSFKPMLAGLSVEKIITLTGLKFAEQMLIAEYSSGMKQRVKLAQAIFSDTPTLLLDEPCTNLDAQGIIQYKEWLAAYGNNRLVIVASNEPREYEFCQHHIKMQDWK